MSRLVITSGVYLQVSPEMSGDITKVLIPVFFNPKSGFTSYKIYIAYKSLLSEYNTCCLLG